MPPSPFQLSDRSLSNFVLYAPLVGGATVVSISLGYPAMQNPLDPSLGRQKEREREIQYQLPTVASLLSGAIRRTTCVTECQPRGA